MISKNIATTTFDVPLHNKYGRYLMWLLNNSKRITIYIFNWKENTVMYKILQVSACHFMSTDSVLVADTAQTGQIWPELTQLAELIYLFSVHRLLNEWLCKFIGLLKLALNFLWHISSNLSTIFSSILSFSAKNTLCCLQTGLPLWTALCLSLSAFPLNPLLWLKFHSYNQPM